jgi:predicted MFS family arabinose efflux permease
MMIGSIAAGQLAGAYGWRSALLLVGLPGVLLAAIAWMVLREPERGRFDTVNGGAKGAPEPISRALAIAWKDRELRRLAFALVMCAYVSIALSTWVPVLLQRDYGVAPARAGVLTALAIGLPTGVGALGGGFLGGRLGRGNPLLLQRFAGAAILLAIPLAIAAPLIVDVRVTLVLYAIWACVGSSYMGPGWGVALARTPAHIRATIMAATLVATNLIGQGLGPQSVGVASDLLAMAGDSEHLRHAMASLALVGLLPASLLIWRRGGAEDVRAVKEV